MHERKPVLLAQRSTALYAKAAFVVGLTLLTILVCWLTPAAKAGGEAGVAMDLPTQVGPLDSFPEDVTPAELYILPKDTTYARRTYGGDASDRHDRILCSIILSGAERRSIHRPERCLPSQGWRIDSSHTETIPLASGRQLGVTALLLEKHVTLANGSPFTLRNYYLYWFVGKDVTTPSQTTRILMTYWDMLVHRINQRWAYVIVSKDISRDWNPNGQDPDQTLAQLKQFIHDSVPYFMESEMPEDKTAAK
jgi:hypothetical protein